MGTRQINTAGPDLINENIIFFKKCDEGHYQKVERIMVRDKKTNKLKLEKEIKSEESYSLVTSDDYDHEIIFQDPAGNDCSMRFKIIE